MSGLGIFSKDPESLIPMGTACLIHQKETTKNMTTINPFDRTPND